MRIIGWILFAILAGLALLTLYPDMFGFLPFLDELSAKTPFAQLIAVRMSLAIGLGILGIVFFIIGVARHHLIRAGLKMSLLGLVFVLVAVVHAGIQINRGPVANTALSSDDGSTPGPESAITVLSYVTGAPSLTRTDDVVTMVQNNGVDVVVLPQATESDVTTIASDLDDADREFAVHTQGDSENMVAILTASSLGEYVDVSQPNVSANQLMVSPSTGVGPVLVAVRPVTPNQEPLALWRGQVAESVAPCHSGSGPLVVAGNFNATVDHAPMRDLGRCADGAIGADIGAVGTWPTSAPAMLGAPVDHVLFDEASYQVREGAVAETGRSNHRALLIRLDPVGSATSEVTVPDGDDEQAPGGDEAPTE